MNLDTPHILSNELETSDAMSEASSSAAADPYSEWSGDLQQKVDQHKAQRGYAGKVNISRWTEDTAKATSQLKESLGRDGAKARAAELLRTSAAEILLALEVDAALLKRPRRTRAEEMCWRFNSYVRLLAVRDVLSDVTLESVAQLPELNQWLPITMRQEARDDPWQVLGTWVDELVLGTARAIYARRVFATAEQSSADDRASFPVALAIVTAEDGRKYSVDEMLPRFEAGGLLTAAQTEAVRARLQSKRMERPGGSLWTRQQQKTWSQATLAQLYQTLLLQPEISCDEAWDVPGMGSWNPLTRASKGHKDLLDWAGFISSPHASGSQ